MASPPPSDGPAAKAAPPGRVAFLDQALWRRFGEADSPEEFTRLWLTLQCSMIAGASAGVVVLGPPDRGPFIPMATWPEGEAGSPALERAAERAMTERRPVANTPKTREGAGGRHQLAYPILLDGRLHGVAGIEISVAAEPDLRALMRRLQWGCGWLEALLRRSAASERSVRTKDTVLDLVATALEHRRFQAAATAVATEIATRLDCDRVSIGFLKGRRVRPRALSHSAQFGKQTNLAQAIGAAMDEALDQYASIRYPGTDQEAGQVQRAHEALAKAGGADYLCTVPLLDGDKQVGAITCERSDQGAFGPGEIAELTQSAALLGPVLETKRKEDRWVLTKALESTHDHLAKVVGPRHFAAKLVALALIAIVVFFVFATGQYRVTADATLEGAVQRVMVAPINGYVAAAEVRAGDVVHEGDTLFTVDDRDLRLEFLKWSSQKEQVKRKYRDALAQHERSEVNVLKAQLDQAEAQLELLGEQISRTQVTAPFDGVIVSGDLSQRLGAPVERGEVLMELAPLEAYRVILQVDERDVTEVNVGQKGHLILSALPQDQLPFVVEKITPVSAPGDGKNSFRVEARLSGVPGLVSTGLEGVAGRVRIPGQSEGAATVLRPGMEGTGKIDVDERRLIWIWTHRLIDWARLWVWSWWP
jgi:multidrug resistance efflux pump